MSPAAFLDAAAHWGVSPGINRAREERRPTADLTEDHEREDP